MEQVSAQIPPNLHGQFELQKRRCNRRAGEIEIGEKACRLSDDEITIFMSSGLSIQNVATARLIFEKVIKGCIGKSVNLVW